MAFPRWSIAYLERLVCIPSSTNVFESQCSIWYPDYIHYRVSTCPTVLLHESDELWFDDESGKEGIRQKRWTMITIATLLYVETLPGVNSIITGQGDNQVIIASFPVAPGMTVEKYVDFHGDELKERVGNYMDVFIDF
uniref:RdRp catalytic domain-containing protein n=1 Tax=Trichuris muris TaxID=70415 RepID=A0A5S6Q4X9_TRIMR